jgi:hypothetical protein
MKQSMLKYDRRTEARTLASIDTDAIKSLAESGRKAHYCLSAIHETLKVHKNHGGLTPIEMFCFQLARKGLGL